MKKFYTCLTASILFCLTAFAQVKGDKYVSGTLLASFGNQSIKANSGNTSSTLLSQPLVTTFGVAGEFGYFLSDNVRLGLAVSLPFSSTPSGEDGDKWLNLKTAEIDISPNIAYYVQLADNLFYTPEAGFSYAIGILQEDQTSSLSYNTNVTGWTVYGNILAFEFRINNKFALGVSTGSISYMQVKTSEDIVTNQFKFNLNSSGSIHARFYL